jgi:ubiquinone biosynthesis protein
MPPARAMRATAAAGAAEKRSEKVSTRRPPKGIGTAIKNAGRLKTIVATFARHGFQNVVERIRLGRFVLERFSNSDIERYSPAERLRMSFEQLGPAFVKFGQLLASRPDLIPEDFVEEFKKLHDQVGFVPFAEIEAVLERQFGTRAAEVFESIDPQPLAAASIAQVHRARLRSGVDVVVKVQRPGIEDVISEDVSVLYWIADALNKYVPESRMYNPTGLVDEFFRSLELETNFIVEANNIRRFQENFRSDPTVVIPGVFFEYSGRRVLVLEALDGVPLSQKRALDQSGVDRQEVMRAGIRAYFKMVFRDGLFHGDLHAGNLFIMPQNRIGLVDFGIVGRLNKSTQVAIANMFVSLYSEDYEKLAFEYVDLAPYDDAIDVDAFARDLRDLLAPYFGLSLRNVDFGRLLMDSTALAARHRLQLPSELMLFFKSIVTVEAMGRMVVQDFDLLAYGLEFASEIVRARYEPKRIKDDLARLASESTSLIFALPRQLRLLARKATRPDFAIRVSLNQADDVRRSIETSANIIFLGLIIGSLILGASLNMFLKEGPYVFQMPALSAILYGLAGALGLVAFYTYIKK